MENKVDILVKVGDATALQNILNIKEGRYEGDEWREPGEERDVLRIYTAKFGDGYEADIKVCNADTPYVDAVLFKDGYEVQVLEISENLLGEYWFEHGGNTLLANLMVDCPRCNPSHSHEAELCSGCKQELAEYKLKVGDTVWIIDTNHRIYQDTNGNRTQTPSYRGYFVPRYILGETKVSWIIGASMNWSPSEGKKIKKSETEKLLYTLEETIDKLCWIHDNCYPLSKRVLDCKDYNLLKKIEEIFTTND